MYSTAHLGAQNNYGPESTFLRDESRVLKSLKKVVNSLCANVRSETPIISLIECMDSCGMPRSTALIPVFCEMLL
jgi:hypothetical protein